MDFVCDSWAHGRCRAYPTAARTDNGPEFTRRACIAWAQSHGVRPILMQPGRPLQNGYIESFNGNFREECHDECCSGYGFETLSQARSTMASWRQDDNHVRPLSGLGQIPPAAFAQRHRIINQTPPACRQEIK